MFAAVSEPAIVKRRREGVEVSDNVVSAASIPSTTSGLSGNAARTPDRTLLRTSPVIAARLPRRVFTVASVAEDIPVGVDPKTLSRNDRKIEPWKAC